MGLVDGVGGWKQPPHACASRVCANTSDPDRHVRPTICRQLIQNLPRNPKSMLEQEPYRTREGAHRSGPAFGARLTVEERTKGLSPPLPRASAPARLPRWCDRRLPFAFRRGTAGSGDVFRSDLVGIHALGALGHRRQKLVEGRQLAFDETERI